MEEKIIFVATLCVLSILSAGTPVAYIFLRLAGKIGPEDDDAALGLGIVLVMLGTVFTTILLRNANAFLG